MFIELLVERMSANTRLPAQISLHPSSLPFTKILFGLPLSSQRDLGKLSTGSDYRVQTKPDHANECFCVLPDLRWSQETLFAWPQEQLKGSKMELP